MRFETTEGSGWTNEAKKALQRIKRKLNKLKTLVVPKEGEILILCLCQKYETISFVLLVKRERIQIPVSYVSRPLQGMEICYTSTEKMVQALIHTTRSLRAIFRKHKVKVITDGPMEEILKLSEKEGKLAKWVVEIRTYDISYILIREAEGTVVKMFFGQGEQVKEMPDANERGTLNLSRKLQVKSSSTSTTWRLYLSRETIEEGSGVGIILVSPEENMYSYAIRLKFNASNHAMDSEALWYERLSCLYGFTKVGCSNRRKPYASNGTREEEVSLGIKTRPSIEETSSSKKGKAASNVPGAKANYN
nr:hypothetical protein [Tanacetum cinerariifolium]